MEITERTGLWTLPWTLDQEKKCHISAAGRCACVPHATGGSAGQRQDIGLQVVAVGLGQRSQTGSVDFGPEVESTSGTCAKEK